MNIAMHKKIFALVLLAFLIVTAFELSNFGMATKADGQMSSCPFMDIGGAVVCKMSPLEHIEAWQNMFTATVSSKTVDTLALLLLVTIIFAAFTTMRLPFNAMLALLEAHQKLYARRAFAPAHVNPMQELFSQGILNPKVY